MKSTAATESTEAMYIDKVAAEFNRMLNNVNYKFLRSRKEAAEQSADARLKRVELLCALHTLFLDILYSIPKPDIKCVLLTIHVLLIDWERWKSRWEQLRTLSPDSIIRQVSPTKSLRHTRARSFTNRLRLTRRLVVVVLLRSSFRSQSICSCLISLDWHFACDICAPHSPPLSNSLG